MRGPLSGAGRVRFTERMHGDGFDIIRLRLAFAAGPDGDDGLPGKVLGGWVTGPGLTTVPWRIDPAASRVSLLHQDPAGGRRMTYELGLRAPTGATTARLLGTKYVTGRGPGRLPARVWRETSTLHLVLTADGAVLGNGTARLHPGDFARQLLGLRGSPAAVAAFVAGFTGRLLRVYRNRS